MPNTSQKPILYSFRRCPYAMRARFALLVSTQSVELREVLLKDKPAELLTLSSKGTVPVLLLPNGQLLDQSLDIMYWALQGHPYLTAYPWDAQLALIQICDGSFKYYLDRYKYPNRYDSMPMEKARAEAMVFIERLSLALRQHTYLVGHECSLADIAIYPFVRQFANTDLAWFSENSDVSLQMWLERFNHHALYDILMHKYSPWKAGQAVEFFPPS